jgi:LysR family glycine cleavage system transcriptional activator
MKKRLPPLNRLRSFEASARHLNFTQAAAELNLTPAAISQQVKGLESQLGMALFKRLPRGLALTEAGQAYMPVVHQSIERLAAATDEIFGQGHSQLLTVRVSLAFFTLWLAPRLARFTAQHPEVGLRFTSNIWVGERDEEADMQIRHGRGIWAGMKSDRLTWDELFPVCSPLLSQGMTPPETPDALLQHTLLHVIGYEEGWGYWLNQAGFHHLTPSRSMQFDTLISALEMAVLGQGLALGRTSLVANMLADGRLVTPFEQRLATSEAFYLACPTHKFAHPSAETFRAWLIEEAESARDEAGPDPQPILN